MSDNDHFFKRAPASQKVCTELVNETMLLFRPSPRFKWWQRFTGNRNLSVDSFSQERMDRLEALYYEDLIKGDSSPKPEASPEGLMAFIRATKSFQLKGENQAREIGEISIAQKRALSELLKKLSYQRSWQFDDIDNLTHVLYTIAFGARGSLGASLSFTGRQRELIVALATEDLAKKGMYESFSHFRFLGANPGPLRKFAQTKFASGLKVSLLNLPMLLGAPPLYLPKVKPPKLSKGLADDLLSEGLTDEVAERISREIGASLVVNDQYLRVRKAYMYGVMIYLVMAQAYDTYQLEAELRESQELIGEAREEADELTQSLDVLEGSSIDVFSEEEIEKGNIFCQNLRECFDAFSVPESDTESEGFKTCQSVIDPGNQCRSL